MATVYMKLNEKQTAFLAVTDKQVNALSINTPILHI